MYTDIFVEKEEMKGYKTGETVAVEIKKWEKSNNSPEGRIIKTFGFESDSLDAYSILYEWMRTIKRKNTNLPDWK